MQSDTSHSPTPGREVELWATGPAEWLDKAEGLSEEIRATKGGNINMGMGRNLREQKLRW